jgi:glycosyltransferase involved in cell wall biosynthesis
MRSEQPLVSVLMTAYNRETFIAEAIESVLASTYTNFELIIVDDCSNDRTVAIAKNYEAKDDRIKVYVNEENLAQFGNRNKAASYAKGIYLKYFDSDDVMLPHCLKVMVNAMENYPEAAAGAITINKPATDIELPIQYTPKESYINHYFADNPLLYIGPSGSIFKKNVFNKFKGFDEQIGILADTLFMMRITAEHNVVGFQDGLFHWRVHDGQVTIGQADWFEMQKQRYEINNIILNSLTLPLSQKEAKIIKRNIKNILIRNIWKRFFYKKYTKGCYKLTRISKLSPLDFLKAFMPNKKLK